MKFLRLFLLLYFFVGVVNAIEVTKSGLIPSYKPYKMSTVLFFLPYNPTILIVGDKIAHHAMDIAKTMELASIYCFTPEYEDFQLLTNYSSAFPNLHPNFGLLHNRSVTSHPYFSALPQDDDCEEQALFRFPGSLLKPQDPFIPCLFGKQISVPTYLLSSFCKEQKLSRIHVIRLNCGGNELQILKQAPEIVDNAIVVAVKTYHQPIRQHMSTFEALHTYMTAHDFELMSHYIYDQVIGDALYVKSKYLSAVFRSKEI